ncbi:MAG: tetratricopeptide repeat protein [Candidatus Omnitrophica bacterium]|nr:tetratricopeptide repeat protein [Candidatus Omnitrophota bacterium]
MTNRNMQFISVFLMSICLITNAFAEETFNDKLSSARRLVEQKSYSEALKIYSGISEELRKDPGLVIEWARVYTYADKHKEAIKLFEEVRSEHPERSAEIIRELADQYKWSGQTIKAIKVYKECLALKAEDLQIFLGLGEALFWNNQKSEALEIYDAALKRWPDNKDALLGKSNILSFQDKLEESYALYQKVLDKDPGNLTALNNQARILVWQGYHRRGISRYEEILERYPKNPDAIEGIAFALHWLGDDVRAVERVKELLEFEPNRKEAQDLYYQIKNSQYPFFRPYGRFTNDSTPQTVTTQGLRSGLHVDYSTSIDGIYEHQVLRKKGSVSTDPAYPLNGTNPSIAADRGGLSFSKSFGHAFEFNTFMYETHFNKADFTPFTTNTWFTYKPGDCWRFDLAYERETFEDNDALSYKVITNSPSFSVDFKPNRFWLFNVKYKRGYYTDDNRQNQVFARAEYRITQKPYVKLYYNYYYSSWGEPQLNHGYFNPRSLLSHSLGAYSGVDLTRKFFIECKASGGYEYQDKSDVNHKKSNHPTCYAAASLNYMLTENWLLSASGDFFSTWPDHGQRSYQRRVAYLSVTYNFGARPVALRGATRPSRPTGGN